MIYAGNGRRSGRQNKPVLNSQPRSPIFAGMMRRFMTSFRRRAMLTGGAVAAAAPLFAATEILPPGFRPLPASVHALTGGTVIVKPGQTLSNATIIIRDGYIESVSTNSAAPADARVWDLKGFTIYAGFIDPYLSTAPKSDNKTTADERQLTSGGVKFYGSKTQETAFSKLTGPGYEVAMVRPEQRMAQNYTPDAKALEKLRELGFTCGNFVPEKGIFRGTSAFATLGDETSERAILKPDVFQHIVFDLENRKEDVYPESLMGVVAVLRQSFLDAQHYADEQSWHEKKPAKTAAAI